MKARLAPLYFVSPDAPGFVSHLRSLRELLGAEADFLDPLPLGERLPDADAVVFPEMVGQAYTRVEELKRLEVPVLVLTSDFATMAMWDWEIISYLRSEGVSVVAPYSLEDALTACRALAAKRALRRGTFVVYQDRPGRGGYQPEIFKRFFWWEDACAERMETNFGVRVLKKSFEVLGARAKAVPDSQAENDWEHLAGSLPVDGTGARSVRSALKLYRALREDVEAEHAVLAAGVNCLNESAFSDTTPCLAWDLLHAERGLTWGCEADLMSMLTQYLLHSSLRVPVVMTNLYPFLMGRAALQHERLPAFPEVEHPEDHVLGAHCGYLGVLPRSMAAEWQLRPKVLAIVDDNATAIDARLAPGDLTLAKLEPSLKALAVVPAQLEGYYGHPGSDCLNAAVIRVPDGHALMKRLPSHHSVLVAGHHRSGLEVVAAVFGLELEVIGG